MADRIAADLRERRCCDAFTPCRRCLRDRGEVAHYRERALRQLEQRRRRAARSLTRV